MSAQRTFTNVWCPSPKTLPSHNQWTHYTSWRSCCSQRRNVSHFGEYNYTYMVKVGTPPPTEPSQTEIRYWTEISVIGLDKARNFSGLRIIVGRAPHSRWHKSIAGYHRKTHRNPRTQYKNHTQPTITSRRPRSCPLCKQVARIDQHFFSKCPYLQPEDRLYLTKARFIIQHRRRITWHHRIDLSCRRWGWSTHTSIRPDCFAP